MILPGIWNVTRTFYVFAFELGPRFTEVELLQSQQKEDQAGRANKQMLFVLTLYQSASIPGIKWILNQSIYGFSEVEKVFAHTTKVTFKFKPVKVLKRKHRLKLKTERSIWGKFWITLESKNQHKRQSMNKIWTISIYIESQLSYTNHNLNLSTYTMEEIIYVWRRKSRFWEIN